MASEFQIAVAKCVDSLWIAFRRGEGPKPPVQVFQVYELGLNGLASAQIEKATGRAITELKFFPVPAELRELAGVHAWSLAEKAERAYEAADKAAHIEGGYKSVCFDDAATNATIRALGGWEVFCTQPTEDHEGRDLRTFQRKDFIQAYQRIAACGVSAEAGGPLGGLIDLSNGMNGHGQKAPLMITTGIPGAKPQIGSNAAPKQIETKWHKSPSPA